MKRFIALSLVLLFTLGMLACAAGQPDETTVRVGIVGETYYEIWAPVIAELEEEGIIIELINFSDYSLPNDALNSGEIDLNSFQHHTFLNNEIATKGYEIVAIADTFLSAMCVYSENISDISELKENDKIALPGDAVNMGRALTILQGAGLITLDPSAGRLADISDVTSNPLNLEFVPVDAASVASLLPDVAAGVINGNFALDFGLSPADDSIVYDDLSFYTDNAYVNVLAVRTEDVDKDIYRRIVTAYQTDAVKRVYLEYFEGSYAPAW